MRTIGWLLGFGLAACGEPTDSGAPATGSTTGSATGSATGAATGGTTPVDGDGDGAYTPEDCDDTNAAVHPGATEVCGNGLDDDCNGGPGDCTFDGQVPMSGSAVRLDGVAYDLAGTSLVNHTDITGDGQNDLLVAAYTSNGQGKVYVVDAPFASGSMATSARAVLGGANPDDVAGVSMDVVGDFDADGVPDLLIGAPGSINVDNGLAYLVSGTVSGTQGLDAAAFVRWQGDTAAWLGAGVAGLGDASGDGVADLALGAPQFDGLEDDSGVVGIFFGPTVTGGSLDGADAAIHGDVPGARIGAPLLGGDLDGDGVGDVAAGVFEPQTGAIALFFGPFSGNVTLAQANGMLVAEENQDWPNAVAGGGDATGDGADDLLVGAEAAATSGVAWLVDGAPTGTLDLFLSEARFIDDELGAAIGGAVSFVGDLDGDGVGDVLLGARGDDTPGLDAGLAYLYYGPVSGNHDVGDADAVFVSPEPYAQAGKAVAAAGDATGDGLGDVWIAAFGQDTNGMDSGAVHLMAGYGW